MVHNLCLQMYTTFVNGYDKAMSVFQETMKENVEFTNLVSEFQVGDHTIGFIVFNLQEVRYFWSLHPF